MNDYVLTYIYRFFVDTQHSSNGFDVKVLCNNNKNKVRICYSGYGFVFIQNNYNRNLVTV